MIELVPLLDLLQKAGPFALFLIAAWAWREERRERMATQKSFNELMAQGLTAMVGTEHALRELRRLFIQRRGQEDVDDDN